MAEPSAIAVMVYAQDRAGRRELLIEIDEEAVRHRRQRERREAEDQSLVDHGYDPESEDLDRQHALFICAIEEAGDIWAGRQP